jgi:hypothetical protein
MPATVDGVPLLLENRIQVLRLAAEILRFLRRDTPDGSARGFLTLSRGICLLDAGQMRSYLLVEAPSFIRQ